MNKNRIESARYTQSRPPRSIWYCVAGIAMVIAGSAGLLLAEEPPRKIEASSRELASLLDGARTVADKQQLKSIVLLASLGRDAKSTALRRFIQDSLLAAFDGGPKISTPPARVKAPPSLVNPTTISRLRWEKGVVPTVLTASATPRRNALEFSFMLLDGKEVFWQGSLTLDRREIAALPLTPLVNQRIVEYAVKQMGQQVGNGECWTLADEALKAAGARHPGTFVWGRPLMPGEEVCPGDVIQFTSVKLEKRGSTQFLGMPNHTAIVGRVMSPGVYVILQQNTGGKAGKTVSDSEIDLSTKTEGKIEIYRPIPKR
ncbi:MAG: hypothetical protein ACLP9L_36205 [Thermoguttaceae bacterium]